MRYKSGNTGTEPASLGRNYADIVFLTYGKRRYRFIFDYKRLNDCDVVLLEGQLDNYGRDNISKLEDKKLALIYSEDDIIVSGIEQLRSKKFRVKSGSEMTRENVQPIKDFWRWLFD